MIAQPMGRESGLDASASRLVLALGLLVGLGNLAYYYFHGLTTAHYDAKAHLVIARSILDSTRPGYAQLGAHWLPLTHLLYLPFVWIDAQYRSGFLPSLISVAAFAFSGWLACRIAARLTGSPASGFFAGIFLIANSNLQYLQSCPLTEPLYMVLLLSAVESLIRWRESGRSNLPWVPAIWISLGALCRYEGWYFFAGVILLLVSECKVGNLPVRNCMKAIVILVFMFLLPVAAHFAYIHAQIGDTFLHRVVRGYSAPYETFRRPVLSAIYHLAELSQIAAILPLIVGFAGTAYCLARCRPVERWAPLFLLWLPSLLNISALYWGLIYRVRYSALLLPALAIFGSLVLVSGSAAKRLLTALCLSAMLLPWLSWYFPHEWKYRFFSPGPGLLILPVAALVTFLIARMLASPQWPLLFLIVLGMQIPALRGEHRPILPETLEHELIEPERRQVLSFIRENYDGSRFLIDMGKLAPLVYDSALPVREFVYREGDSALWRRALNEPHRIVGWLCAEKGDEVWQVVQVDPHWADRYSLAVQTEHFFIYRLRPEFREALLIGRRLE